MSTKIDVSKIMAVQLADKWHTVLRDTFVVDTVEFCDEEGSDLFQGPETKETPLWFWFTEFEMGGNKPEISGPLTSIVALKLTP